MRANLFFAMLREGRAIHNRKKSREYFELCRVSDYPHLQKQSREEVIQWYWDNSLDMAAKIRRDRFIKKVKESDQTAQLPPSAALDFFKRNK